MESEMETMPQSKNQKKAEEGLEKHRDIVEKYAKETGLTVDIGLDGNFELKKQFSEDNIAELVGLRLVEDGCIAINIYDRTLIDSAYSKLVKPIIKSGNDVIFINRDIDDRTIAGLTILDTCKKTK